ncbi:TPA: hypothetical protein LR286_003259 [Enterobacter hormaechei]|nr:hypothetical protein [Enterobacter hormaechei]HBL9125591.1 hypothetical protein [Enterobacter hormaechei]HCC6647860.1 hypothetical protein [Enterobacter hormaechei]
MTNKIENLRVLLRNIKEYRKEYGFDTCLLEADIVMHIVHMNQTASVYDKEG